MSHDSAHHPHDPSHPHHSHSNPALQVDTIHPHDHEQDPQLVDSNEDDPLHGTTALEVAPSWQEQPVRLPAYTPSIADRQQYQDSPPTTPLDDPIHRTGVKKHFGFSSKQSRASSIFPWLKHKPAVCHQYAPQRPPLSKRPSLAGLKVVPVAGADPVKHMEEEELDLVNLKGEKLAERTLELLHRLQVGDWSQVQDPALLKMDRISGALTNCIFLVTGPPSGSPSSASDHSSGDDHSTTSTTTSTSPKPRKVLLRVYGIGLDDLISRDKELYWLENLSTMDIGPSLLGIFKNGRFEQYVESTTLTKEDIRDPRTSRHIAHRMCELHNIVNVFPPPEGTVPVSKENIAKWIPLARKAIQKIGEKDEGKRKALEEFGFERLVEEIDEVHQQLESVHSPIVFSHNDTQYGNILRSLDESKELVVIDFEYAGYNTRGFDIGNHFCEWTADYHSDRPSILHPDRYPTKDEQLNFLEAYMEAEIAMSGFHLTAINLAKYAKKRRSIVALAHGVAQAARIAVSATSSVMKKHRSSVDFSAGRASLENSKGQAAEKTIESLAASLESASSSAAATAGTLASPATATTTAPAPLPPHGPLDNGASMGRPPSPKECPIIDTSTPSTTTQDIRPATPLSSTTISSKGNTALEHQPHQPLHAKIFVEATHGEEGGGGGGGGGVSKAEILDSMYKEVNKFALTSHLMWGLWGLIQATHSDIDFDYAEYSLQRLGEFRRRREEFMSL